MKVIYIDHGGAGNHGCEAIIRSSMDLLGSGILASHRPDEDIKYKLDNIAQKITGIHPISRINKFQEIVSKLQTKLFNNIDRTIEYKMASQFKEAEKGDLVLSVGGDNYCYPGSEVYGSVCRNFKKRGAKVILWGCSVEPKSLKDPEIRRDIRSYDAIFAREQISYQALKSVTNNVFQIPDPAFFLKPDDSKLSEEFKTKKYFGINISPLVLKASGDYEAALNSFQKLIEYLLSETDYNVLLIPHVIWDHDDDRNPITELYSRLTDNHRVIKIEDNNCQTLKAIISSCEAFVGCRTHSMVAAYSSFVPSIAIGYSVKAYGMAKDLFKKPELLVLDSKSLIEPSTLVERVQFLIESKTSIQNELYIKIPEYKNSMFSSLEQSHLLEFLNPLSE